jgi:hypothetical protein
LERANAGGELNPSKELRKKPPGVHARRFACLGKIDMKTNIPTTSLAVTDGTTLIGHIVARDGSYFAFRPDNSLLGKFATQGEAVRALPAADASTRSK